MGSLLMKYLCLQLEVRKRDMKSWNQVLELVSFRLVSWQPKFLSLGGQVVLIKSVLNSILLYQMLVNVLPEGVKGSFRGCLVAFSGVVW